MKKHIKNMGEFISNIKHKIGENKSLFSKITKTKDTQVPEEVVPKRYDGVKLINCLPFDVTDCNTNQTFKTSGINCFVKTRNEVCYEIKDIPVYRSLIDCDVINLPEPQYGTLYIVSELCLKALNGKRDDLIAPFSLIKDIKGTIIGTDGFCVHDTGSKKNISTKNNTIENKSLHIINCTSHNINETISGKTFNTSGREARVKASLSKKYIVNGMPVFNISPLHQKVYGLPEPRENTIYIVSSLSLKYLNGTRGDVVAPGKQVRDENNKIVGCSGFRIE